MTAWITPLDLDGNPTGEPRLLDVVKFEMNCTFDPIPDPPPRSLIPTEPMTWTFTMKPVPFGRGARRDWDRLVGVTYLDRSRRRKRGRKINKKTRGRIR